MSLKAWTHRPWLAGMAVALTVATAVGAQQDQVTVIDMAVGRSVPLDLAAGITKVSVADPAVADVVVISTVELVVNARAVGETDAIVWQENGIRTHYRLVVKSSAERQQIVVAIKFAEVDRTLLSQLGFSGIYNRTHVIAGSNAFSQGSGATAPGLSTVPVPAGQFISVLTDFDTKNLLGLLQAQEQRGKARTLAEPTVMAGNNETADFLAGGEVPVPVVQTAQTNVAGGAPVTIQYKEFGIRLHFVAEILSDTLIRLHLRPEVSNLDFSNAITLSGFRIPALTTRRVESTVDVRRGESLILSGMFDDVWQRNRTGVPLLQNIPILGLLFSSTQWQHNETELLIVVTPVVVDPRAPRAQDVLPIVPDTTLPARDAIEPRLARPGQMPGTGPPR